MHSKALLLILVIAMTASYARSDDVLINEIMYHPASEDPKEAYIELLNTGTHAVALNGWRLTT